MLQVHDESARIIQITLVAGLLLCALSAPAAAQCDSLVSVPTSNPVSIGCNALPLGQDPAWSAGYTYLQLIPASLMNPGNPYVNDIAFSPCGSGTWSCNTVVIGLGHVPNPRPGSFAYPSFDAAGGLQNIGSFLDFTIVHNSFVGGSTGPVSTTGPFSWSVTQDAWSPMGFSSSVGTGFSWNGVDDVAFFITFQNSVVTGFTGSFHNDAGARYYAAGFNAPLAATNNDPSALLLQLDVTRGPNQTAAPTWQCNQTSASLSVNGAQDPGSTLPMSSLLGLNAPAVAGLSGLVGAPWDIALTAPQLGLALGSGGIVTAGNQTINVDLGAPSLQFLFNAAFANALVATTIPVTSTSPASLAAQQVVLDPGQADGFSLSHLNEISWLACSVNQDFEAMTIGNLTGANRPVSWIAPSNGGAPWTVNTAGTPTAGTGPTAAAGGTNYAFCDSSAAASTRFSFDTCASDITQLSLFTLNFSLSRIGAAVGTLNIYADDGSGTFATLLASYTGADPLQTQGGMEWSNKAIFFNPTTAQVAFRFEYQAGPSALGDLAIDELSLQ